MNNLNPNVKHFVPKGAMDNAELAARVEIIKINKERKEMGLPYLTAQEQEKMIMDASSTTKQQKSETEVTSKPTTKEELGKKFGISNEALTNLLAMFSTKRQEAIAIASQKDTQVILQFKDRTPPKLGEKPSDNTNRFTQLVVHYNKVPWDIYEEVQRLQGEVADLNKIKQMTLNQMDENGTRVKPPELSKNNPAVTGLSDADFSKLNRLIAEKQAKLYQIAGLWMYGIPEEDTMKCETLTLSLAVEAGLYRLQFGYPSENPNSTSYVK